MNEYKRILDQWCEKMQQIEWWEGNRAWMIAACHDGNEAAYDAFIEAECEKAAKLYADYEDQIK